MKKKLYPSFSVLLVDDEPAWLRSLDMMLDGKSSITNTILCQDARQVMDILAREDVGLVLLDLTMPHVSGQELIPKITAAFPSVIIIVITALNEVGEAVRCMQIGAYDYYVKTSDRERIVAGILHAVQLIELQRESIDMRSRLLSDRLEKPEAFTDIITTSSKMFAIFRYIEALAESRQPVLVTGESGVGKDLIVRALHKAGGYEVPMVSVNLAGLDDNMFADTLFGHKRGAFTGAVEDRRGLVGQAEGTILFLDEIGDLSPVSQVKLLRLLQDGEYYPVGSDRLKRTKTRFALATNKNILEKQRLGEFRNDLFYRLKTHHIHVPPLRERKEDIPLLLRYFAEQAAQELGRPCPAIPKQIAALLMQYDFPGNVRELKSMIYDEVSRSRESLSVDGFKSAIRDQLCGELWPDTDGSDEEAVFKCFLSTKRLPTFAETEEILINAALRRADGHQTLAARMLGISQPALSKRLSVRKQDTEK
jgi:DNA-binding NtrC family response regulator